jgi:hypothetical protein
MEVWTDVDIGGAGGRFGQVAGTGPVSGVQWRGCPLAPSEPATVKRGKEQRRVGDHLDAAPARLVRPDHDRQARRSYATAVNEMSAAG